MFSIILSYQFKHYAFTFLLILDFKMILICNTFISSLISSVQCTLLYQNIINLTHFNWKPEKIHWKIFDLTTSVGVLLNLYLVCFQYLSFVSALNWHRSSRLQTAVWKMKWNYKSTCYWKDSQFLLFTWDVQL